MNGPLTKVFVWLSKVPFKTGRNFVFGAAIVLAIISAVVFFLGE